MLAIAATIPASPRVMFFDIVSPNFCLTTPNSMGGIVAYKTSIRPADDGGKNIPYPTQAFMMKTLIHTDQIRIRYGDETSLQGDLMDRRHITQSDTPGNWGNATATGPRQPALPDFRPSEAATSEASLTAPNPDCTNAAEHNPIGTEPTSSHPDNTDGIGTTTQSDVIGTESHCGIQTIPGADGWRPLPPRVRTVWLITEAFQCAIWLAVCGVIAAICLANGWWGFWQRLIIGVAVVYAVLELVSQPLQTKYMYAFTRFRIGECDLATRKGWLFRTSTTTPYTRVQHVDTKQNPVQRHFGLTTVVVHTAADEHEIAALDTAEAERIVALITERVAAAKDDL
ncbi:PH domain-containing protein [Bifidobacterium reuteri]|nr:PH domain-containing protein [Bifidobacterium reuteri]